MAPEQPAHPLRMRLLLLAILIFGSALLYAYHTHQLASHKSHSTVLLAPPPTKSTLAPKPLVPALKSSDLAAEDPVASYEDLMYAQPDLIDASLQQLRAQTPGKIDLYAIGFAGDAAQPPFRNEVDYLSRLMTQRFDAAGHTVELINSPKTFEHTPLATRTNLYEAIAGIAKKMDVDEDMLLLFLTSHGSPDHELYVEMGAMPLDQLEPEDIRDALDAAHIRWRIVIVSACYSGGFIPALRDPHTLIITAARSDRASFGCGNNSQITWFGKAFLTQAFNETTDFHDAFVRARKIITGWETRDHETPSEPQYWAGPLIESKLAAWRAPLVQTSLSKTATTPAGSARQ